MTAMITNRTLLREAPAVEARFSSLLEVATVLDGVSHEDGAGLYASLHNLTDAVTTAICSPQSGKTFQGPTIVTGSRFATYIGLSCFALGSVWSDLDAQFTTVEELDESRAVEKKFLLTVLNGATDLTPVGGAVSPKVGAAMLEEHAAANYSGLPTLHYPYSIASILFGQGPKVERVGQVYRSPLGANIVVGAGYSPNLGPDGSSPSVGERWLYGTGAVTIERGNEIRVPAQLDRGSNKMFDLIERVYVADVDTYKAAVRVSVQ